MVKIFGFIALIALACLIAMMALMSCSNPEARIGEQVKVIITDIGCDIEGTDVLIDNYYKGARAEVEYLVTNDSNTDIEPEIYIRFNVNPANYSKGNGYEPVPHYYTDWIDIPRCGVIEPKSAKAYLVILEIPEGCEEEIPDKWAFKIGVNPHSGPISSAVSTWWRVDMR